MVAILAGLGTALAVGLAEFLHGFRIRGLARLAFGPGRRPSAWAHAAPFLRSIAAGATAWGLVTLMTIKPRSYETESLPDNQRRHLMIVLDVSPSMKLKDAGPDFKQSRSKRVFSLMESFFGRAPIDQYFVSVVACYNGAKPVVVATKDVEVVRNILDDLPLHYAFPVGKTDLFAGLTEAAKIAQPWRPRSTLLVMLTDGDTVPATGMPRMPDSISDVLVVGVGDPRAGSFIEGHQSRQDAGTLRQVATRLGGTYHDGNEKHLPTELIRGLTLVPRKSPFEQLTRREYALMALGAGAAILAFLPVLLHHFGTRWRPGIPARKPVAKEFVVAEPAAVG